MAKGLSPTQRTLRALREQGIIAEVVERFNPHVGEHGIRQDCFGVLDIIALDVVNTIGIQACAGSGFRAHWNKLTVEKAENSIEWLTAPTRKLQIWAWRRTKLHRGGKAMRWNPKIVEVRLQDITGTDKDG